MFQFRVCAALDNGEQCLGRVLITTLVHVEPRQRETRLTGVSRFGVGRCEFRDHRFGLFDIAVNDMLYQLFIGVRRGILRL